MGEEKLPLGKRRPRAELCDPNLNAHEGGI